MYGWVGLGWNGMVGTRLLLRKGGSWEMDGMGEFCVCWLAGFDWRLLALDGLDWMGCHSSPQVIAVMSLVTNIGMNTWLDSTDRDNVKMSMIPNAEITPDIVIWLDRVIFAG